MNRRAGTKGSGIGAGEIGEIPRRRNRRMPRMGIEDAEIIGRW